MSHPSAIVACQGPESPHAFDNVPLQPRGGMLEPLVIGGIHKGGEF